MVEGLFTTGALHPHARAAAPQAQHVGMALHADDAGQQARGHGVGAVAHTAHAFTRHAGRDVAGHHLGRVGARVGRGAGADGGDGRQQQAVDEGRRNALGKHEVADAQAFQGTLRQRSAHAAAEVQGAGHDAPGAGADQVLWQHVGQRPAAPARAAPAEVGLGVGAGEGGGVVDRLGGQAEFGVKAHQRRVVAGQEDAQRHVDAQITVHRHRTGHEAGLRVALEKRHRVLPGQQPRGHQAGDAATDHGDVHAPRLTARRAALTIAAFTAAALAFVHA